MHLNLERNNITHFISFFINYCRINLVFNKINLLCLRIERLIRFNYIRKTPFITQNNRITGSTTIFADTLPLF